MNKFLDNLLDTSRLFSILYENLPEEIRSAELYNEIISYIAKYSQYNNLSSEELNSSYSSFIAAYNKHIKSFCRTGKYPFEEELPGKVSFSRIEYDVALLLSVLFTKHRYRIMELLNKQPFAEKALYIGIGPGLEISLTRTKHSDKHAYDLTVNDFLLKEFHDVNINKTLYTGQNENYFDVIYLIELLEHLNDPFELLKICYRSLKTGGRIALTTAVDIPQFDHLYKFRNDDDQFVNELRAMGFEVTYNEIIPHNYLTLPIRSSNRFYEIQKTGI